MGINIWLPILVNLLILGIMVAGVFVGKKYGVKVELLKAGILCSCAVGIYFLSAVITNALLTIPFFANAVITEVISVASIKALVIDILFLTVYGITSLIFSIVVKKIRKNDVGANIIKEIKKNNLTKAEAKKLKKDNKEIKKRQKLIRKTQNKSVRKEERKKRKQERKNSSKQLSKVSKVFGAIIGVVCATIIGFIVTMPLKPIFGDIAKSDAVISEITKGYEYTPYGELNNLTGVVDFIIK